MRTLTGPLSESKFFLQVIKFLDKKTGKGLFPPASTPEGAKVVAMEDESDSAGLKQGDVSQTSTSYPFQNADVLSPLLRYYALYDQAGFDRCFRKKGAPPSSRTSNALSQTTRSSVTEAVPLGLGFLVIPFLGGTRAHFKDVLQKAVPSLDTNNPAAVRAFLDALLARYEAGLPSAESGYLCGTKSASAADISVLSLLERMVSQTGDAAFPPCLPDALDNKPKMQAWLQRMEAEFSISYLKHERPKSMPRPPALLRDL